jgi:hypothetical protein
MEKLTEKELLARLKHFNISKTKLLKAISCSYSYPEYILANALSCCSSYGEVIAQSLVWMDTPQGHNFWKGICDNIDEIETSFKNQINKIKIK